MKLHHYSTLLNAHGSPLYVYDETVIARQLNLLRETFPGFSPLYSLKTNPHPAICRFMATNELGIDAASSFEVNRALEAGIAPENIFYSAPGKSRAHLAEALGKCLIVADSCSELVRLNELAGETEDARKLPLRVGIRINPDFAFGPGELPEITAGASSKFGVDEEFLLTQKPLFDSLKHIRICGIHVFLRSQVLSHSALAAMFATVFNLAARCREALGWQLEFINFGGGIGIAPTMGCLQIADFDSRARKAGLFAKRVYSYGTRPEQKSQLDAAIGQNTHLETAPRDYPEPNLRELRDEVSRLAAAHAPSLPGCTLMLESGRFLVGKAGVFLTRIEDIKESRGKTYAIVSSGMNAFFRPALMNLLNGLPSPPTGPFEPLFSNYAAHTVSLPEKSDGELKKVTVCGNLCTAMDVLANDVLLPDPQVGDVLAVANAGAYAVTLSPFAFTSFPRPTEVYVDLSGTILPASLTAFPTHKP